MSKAQKITMARAYDGELENLEEFFGKLDQLLEGNDDFDEIGRTIFDLRDEKHFSVDRITNGYRVMFDNACDPERSYLEFKPEIREAINAYRKQAQLDFASAFSALARQAYQTAVRKGFHDEERPTAVAIALMHAELSEALEAVRNGSPADDKLPDFYATEVEFADVIIRIMDTAAHLGLRVGEAVVAKMAYNEGRPHKHGKEF